MLCPKVKIYLTAHIKHVVSCLFNPFRKWGKNTNHCLWWVVCQLISRLNKPDSCLLVSFTIASWRMFLTLDRVWSEPVNRLLMVASHLVYRPEIFSSLYKRVNERSFPPDVKLFVLTVCCPSASLLTAFSGKEEKI